MRWLKLTIAYDGSAYAGWQVQPDRATVQGAIEEAWRKIAQESVRLTAAGRTDAGVHALGQVAGVVTESRLACDVLQRGLNAVLPEDVVIVSLEEARHGFHATHDAVAKRYHYQIHNGRVASVFDRGFSWHYPHPLDVESMHRAGQWLVGRHDFSSFESAGSERPDSIRTVYELAVWRSDGFAGRWRPGAPSTCPRAPVDFAEGHALRASRAEGDSITVAITGDGFLYNMVRAIVGTLVEVGRGRRDTDWPGVVLAARDRRRAGQTAPALGLFLISVDY